MKSSDGNLSVGQEMDLGSANGRNSARPAGGEAFSWIEDGNGFLEDELSPDSNEFTSLLQNLLSATDMNQPSAASSARAPFDPTSVMLPIPSGPSFAQQLWEEEEKRAGHGPILHTGELQAAQAVTASGSPGTLSQRQSPGSVLPSVADSKQLFTSRLIGNDALGGKSTLFIPVTPMRGDRRIRLIESPEARSQVVDVHKEGSQPRLVDAKPVAPETQPVQQAATGSSSFDQSSNPGLATAPSQAKAAEKVVPKRESWADSPGWSGEAEDRSGVSSNRTSESGSSNLDRLPSWGRGTGTTANSALPGMGRGQGSLSASRGSDFPALGGVRVGQARPPEMDTAVVMDKKDFPELPRAAPKGSEKKEGGGPLGQKVVQLKKLTDLSTILSPHKNAWACWNPVSGSKESQEDIEAAQKEMAAELQAAQKASLPRSESDKWDDDERAGPGPQEPSTNPEPYFSWEQQKGYGRGRGVAPMGLRPGIGRGLGRWQEGHARGTDEEGLESRGFPHDTRFGAAARGFGGLGSVPVQGGRPPRTFTSRSDAADSWRRKDPSDPQSEASKALDSPVRSAVLGSASEEKAVPEGAAAAEGTNPNSESSSSGNTDFSAAKAELETDKLSVSRDSEEKGQESEPAGSSKEDSRVEDWIREGEERPVGNPSLTLGGGLAAADAGREKGSVKLDEAVGSGPSELSEAVLSSGDAHADQQEAEAEGSQSSASTAIVDDEGDRQLVASEAGNPETGGASAALPSAAAFKESGAVSTADSELANEERVFEKEEAQVPEPVPAKADPLSYGSWYPLSQNPKPPLPQASKEVLPSQISNPFSGSNHEGLLPQIPRAFGPLSPHSDGLRPQTPKPFGPALVNTDNLLSPNLNSANPASSPPGGFADLDAAILAAKQSRFKKPGFISGGPTHPPEKWQKKEQWMAKVPSGVASPGAASKALWVPKGEPSPVTEAPASSGSVAEPSPISVREPKEKDAEANGGIPNSVETRQGGPSAEAAVSSSKTSSDVSTETSSSKSSSSPGTAVEPPKGLAEPSLVNRRELLMQLITQRWRAPLGKQPLVWAEPRGDESDEGGGVHSRRAASHSPKEGGAVQPARERWHDGGGQDQLAKRTANEGVKQKERAPFPGYTAGELAERHRRIGQKKAEEPGGVNGHQQEEVQEAKKQGSANGHAKDEGLFTGRSESAAEGSANGLNWTEEDIPTRAASWEAKLRKAGLVSTREVIAGTGVNKQLEPGRSPAGDLAIAKLSTGGGAKIGHRLKWVPKENGVTAPAEVTPVKGLDSASRHSTPEVVLARDVLEAILDDALKHVEGEVHEGGASCQVELPAVSSPGIGDEAGAIQEEGQARANCAGHQADGLKGAAPVLTTGESASGQCDDSQLLQDDGPPEVKVLKKLDIAEASSEPEHRAGPEVLQPPAEIEIGSVQAALESVPAPVGTEATGGPVLKLEEAQTAPVESAVSSDARVVKATEDPMHAAQVDFVRGGPTESPKPKPKMLWSDDVEESEAAERRAAESGESGGSKQEESGQAGSVLGNANISARPVSISPIRNSLPVETTVIGKPSAAVASDGAASKTAQIPTEKAAHAQQADAFSAGGLQTGGLKSAPATEGRNGSGEKSGVKRSASRGVDAASKNEADVWTFPEEALQPSKAPTSPAKPSSKDARAAANKALSAGGPVNGSESSQARIGGSAAASGTGPAPKKMAVDASDENFERLFLDIYEKLAFKLGRPFDISILLTELKKRVPRFDIKQTKYTRFVDLCKAMADKGHVRLFRASNMTFAALPDDPAQYGWGPNGLYQLPVGTNRPSLDTSSAVPKAAPSAASGDARNFSSAGVQNSGQTAPPVPSSRAHPASSPETAPPSKPASVNTPKKVGQTDDSQHSKPAGSVYQKVDQVAPVLAHARAAFSPGPVGSGTRPGQGALPRATSLQTSAQGPAVAKPAAAAPKKGAEKKKDLRSKADVEAEALGAIMLFLCENPSQQASDLGIKLIAHDRSLSEQVKIHFGGVKSFLKTRPELFYISDIDAHNPRVALFTGQDRPDPQPSIKPSSKPPISNGSTVYKKAPEQGVTAAPKADGLLNRGLANGGQNGGGVRTHSDQVSDRPTSSSSAHSRGSESGFGGLGSSGAHEGTRREGIFDSYSRPGGPGILSAKPGGPVGARASFRSSDAHFHGPQDRASAFTRGPVSAQPDYGNSVAHRDTSRSGSSDWGQSAESRGGNPGASSTPQGTGVGSVGPPKRAEWHLFLNHLPMDCPSAELKSVLSQFGEVHGLSLPRGRMFGFVRFTNAESAREALARGFFELGKKRVTMQRYSA